MALASALRRIIIIIISSSSRLIIRRILIRRSTCIHSQLLGCSSSRTTANVGNRLTNNNPRRNRWVVSANMLRNNRLKASVMLVAVNHLQAL